ncbi:hypothetical protein HY612_01485 [Candidatus Roizmanbacteria bacterium]|nr:hypothetical protein [Candidatus Roizmanbacteria bacterium]
MRRAIERRCLYPIIEHFPFLRPIAGALISPTLRRSIRNPPFLYSEGLRARMQNEGITLKEAYRLTIEQLKKEKGYEHIPVVDAAYRMLKREENGTR